jgi:acyl-CoA thioester hydrolase
VGAYVTQVALRWSDMDAFGHVNHARTVTLLEEARAGLLFTEAHRHGMEGMADGMVVARVVIDYHVPLVYSAGSLQVRMSVRDLRAASFVIDYVAHAGTAEGEYSAAGSETSASVATAETLMVPYDLGKDRPRRLTDSEREFLAQWQVSQPAQVGGTIADAPAKENDRA